MTDTSSSHHVCVFNSVNEKPCKRATLPGYNYCDEHLKVLMPDEAKSMIIEIICDEIGVDEFDEVSEQSRIEEDLGGTSIDHVELVMRLEEKFNVEIPDEVAGTLQSVRDFISYIADALMRERSKTLDPDTDAAPTTDNKVRKAQYKQRILEQTIESEQFRSYYEALGLDANEIVRLFRKIIGKNRIYHVTMIVDDKDGRELEDDEDGGKVEKESEPNWAHIFLLGKDKIYYFKLVGGFVWFEWAALTDLILTYEITLGQDKKASKVIVKSRPRDGSAEHSSLRENLRDAMFKFKGDQIEGALDFLAKYLANMEGEDE